MNLRLREGIDLAAYELRWGTRPDADKIAALVEQGFLTLDGDTLAATPQGRLLLNRVIEAASELDERLWKVVGAGLTTWGRRASFPAPPGRARMCRRH